MRIQIVCVLCVYWSMQQHALCNRTIDVFEEKCLPTENRLKEIFTAFFQRHIPSHTMGTSFLFASFQFSTLPLSHLAHLDRTKRCRCHCRCLSLLLLSLHQSRSDAVFRALLLRLAHSTHLNRDCKIEKSDKPSNNSIQHTRTNKAKNAKIELTSKSN